MTIDGTWDARFDALRDAFRDNFAQRNELGAALTVIVDGRVVVDAWGGHADEARTRPWERDTLVNVFSVGKALAAICALRAVEDLDAPIARHWPEFAAEGKADIDVRTLLAHRAGLPAIARELPAGALYDWDVMAGALAQQAPWWEPGTKHGYHVNTFGFLVGEIVARASGERFGAYFANHVAGPLGADVQFGCPPADRHRTADFLFGDATAGDPRNDGGAKDRDPLLLARAYLNPPGVSGTDGTVNSDAWRAAEIPSANAHATARGVAQIYAALLNHELLSRARLDEATTEASAGPDAVLGRPSRFGLGFQLTQPERPLGPNPRAFGHFGAGGSLAFADPDANLAFAYTINRGGPRWRNPRNAALIEALYDALAQ